MINLSLSDEAWARAHKELSEQTRKRGVPPVNWGEIRKKIAAAVAGYPGRALRFKAHKQSSDLRYKGLNEVLEAAGELLQAMDHLSPVEQEHLGWNLGGNSSSQMPNRGDAQKE